MSLPLIDWNKSESSRNVGECLRSRKDEHRAEGHERRDRGPHSVPWGVVAAQPSTAGRSSSLLAANDWVLSTFYCIIYGRCRFQPYYANIGVKPIRVKAFYIALCGLYSLALSWQKCQALDCILKDLNLCNYVFSKESFSAVTLFMYPVYLCHRKRHILFFSTPRTAMWCCVPFLWCQ